MNLKDKIVVVTGAGSGIGEATARRFLEEGSKVVLCDLEKSKLTETVEGFSESNYLLLSVDVSKEEEVKNMLQKTLDKFGGVDVLVNNAGVYVKGKLPEASTEDWRSIMGTDLDAVFFTCRNFIPKLIERKGCIVNVSSVSGLGADEGNPIYNAAKGAVTNLTRALALDHAGDGLRVNAVCPTFTKTGLTEEMLQDDEIVSKFVNRIPLGRPGEPEDIASAIAFLASDDARFITGVNLPVDGGLMASNGQPLHLPT